MAKVGDVTSGLFSASCLTLGCALGAFAMLGGPLLVAHYDASIWWLLIPATYLAFSNGRGITAYNLMWGSRGKLRSTFYVIILPIAMAFGIEWLLYKGVSLFLD